MPSERAIEIAAPNFQLQSKALSNQAPATPLIMSNSPSVAVVRSGGDNMTDVAIVTLAFSLSFSLVLFLSFMDVYKYIHIVYKYTCTYVGDHQHGMRSYTTVHQRNLRHSEPDRTRIFYETRAIFFLLSFLIFHVVLLFFFSSSSSASQSVSASRLSNVHVYISQYQDPGTKDFGKTAA